MHGTVTAFVYALRLQLTAPDGDRSAQQGGDHRASGVRLVWLVQRRRGALRRTALRRINCNAYPPTPLLLVLEAACVPKRSLAAQIRRLSVKKVVNPVARDNLGNALPGGLLDPAMGPTEPHAS